jgi:long-chain acyl-CoA synthetase
MRSVFDPTKPPQTLAELAQRSFSRVPQRPCLGQKTDGAYQFATYAQIAERVKNLSGAFLEIGIERGDRIAILGDNKPEWALCDLACQMCGIISVPLFSTLPPGQIQTILDDAKPRAILVADAKQAKKIEQIRAEVPLWNTFGNTRI